MFSDLVKIMTDRPDSNPSEKLSPVELAKAASNYLRGTLVESLADAATGALAEDDTQLSKFHGFYQQDDRDIRAERTQQKLEPAYSFMIRSKLPGGAMSAEQYLLHDDITDRYGDSTLRITTRQGFQLYGVVKGELRATIAPRQREAQGMEERPALATRRLLHRRGPGAPGRRVPRLGGQQPAAHAPIHAATMACGWIHRQRTAPRRPSRVATPGTGVVSLSWIEPTIRVAGPSAGPTGSARHETW